MDEQSRLKKDIVEHYDYEAVTADIWRYLSSWYHYDVELPRFLVYDMRSEQTHLELYPE